MDKKNGTWDRSYLKNVKSIEKVDEYTIRIRFKEASAVFISILSYPPGKPISMKALKGDGFLKASKNLDRKIQMVKKKIAKLEKKAAKAQGKSAKKATKKVDKARKGLAKLEAQHARAIEQAGGAKSTDTHSVGTNAYMFDDHLQGNWIRLKRNPDFWYGKRVGRPDMPYFDAVKFMVIPDQSIQLANLKVGKIHEMNLVPAQYNYYQKKPHSSIRTVVMNKPHLTFFMINHMKGPCQDLRVRQAISHAIDRKALIHGVMFGLARPASCVYPSDQWSHNPNLDPVEYDPEKSRRLLAEAGYGEGLSIKGFASNNPQTLAVVTAMQNMLAKVGIDWKADVLDRTAADD